MTYYLEVVCILAIFGKTDLWLELTGNTTYQWQFGDDGNLTLPDTTGVLANVSITLEANDTGNITGLSLIVVATVQPSTSQTKCKTALLEALVLNLDQTRPVP